MKRIVTTVLLATVALSIAEPTTDVAGLEEAPAEQLHASELLKAIGGTFFRIRMPAEVSGGATACLIHKLPDGTVKQLAVLSDIKPNQMLTLVFIKTGQKRPYFSLSHATSNTCGEVEVDTPFLGYSPSSKIYSVGDALVTFNYVGTISEDGKADTTVSSLFVRLQNKKEGEQGGTGQPVTRPESKSESGDKPQPEAEGRSR
jgi:hypothetical protein